MREEVLRKPILAAVFLLPTRASAPAEHDFLGIGQDLVCVFGLA